MINPTNNLTISQSALLGSGTNTVVLQGAGALAVQNPGVTTNFEGTPITSLGNAILNSVSNLLTIGNLGASGLDGADFNTVGAQQIALHWEDRDPSNSLPVGAYVEEDLFGTGGTVTNGLVATVKFVKQGVSNYLHTADFSPMGATTLTAQVLANGQTVGEGWTVPNGPVANVAGAGQTWNTSSIGPGNQFFRLMCPASSQGGN